MTSVRQYKVEVSGFDFRFVWARASSHAKARSIVARAFEDAGYGTFGDGIRHIRSCRLDRGAERPLVSPRRGPEGLCSNTAGPATPCL